ncbi:MAG: hypothetical protein IPO92_13385 [Saprospiraceae bacterium]|nr:hypothetical protein [Saprospiraceae bacterium]
MKHFCILLLLVSGQILSGQQEKHLKIPGTKCSIIPPNGFEAATTFSGFMQAETGASIMVNEIPASYDPIIAGFTADALKKTGMTLQSKETIDFNKSKATLIKVTQAANGTIYIKQMLIFGDEKGTVLVNGIYPESSIDIEPSIKEALLSTVYNAALSENALDAATFMVNIEGTDFKLIKYMSGSLLYSTDGKIPTEKPTLIVGNSLSKVPALNQKKYAEERLKKLPRGEFSTIKKAGEITIDNLSGYEIIADGLTKDNKPELLYQVMLFNESGDYYIILGQAKEDFVKYLESFKKIAKSFTRK